MHKKSDLCIILPLIAYRLQHFTPFAAYPLVGKQIILGGQIWGMFVTAEEQYVLLNFIETYPVPESGCEISKMDNSRSSLPGTIEQVNMKLTSLSFFHLCG